VIDNGIYLTHAGAAGLVRNSDRIAIYDAADPFPRVVVVQPHFDYVRIGVEIYVERVEHRRKLVAVVIADICTDEAIYRFILTFRAFEAGLATAEALCTGAAILAFQLCAGILLAGCDEHGAGHGEKATNSK
jgi:hypothetical protein